jgi:hypothetical protein
MGEMTQDAFYWEALGAVGYPAAPTPENAPVSPVGVAGATWALRVAPGPVGVLGEVAVSQLSPLPQAARP